MSSYNFPRDKDFNDAVTDQILGYVKLFAAQVEVSHTWPRKFHFPEPSNDVERVAMRYFIDELERKMNTRIELVHSVERDARTP